MSNNRRLILTTALFASVAAPLAAAPTLHPLIADNAILQRGEQIRIFGTAAPNEQLTVRLGTATRTGRADANGNWLVAFPRMTSSGALNLQAVGNGGATASATNLKIGDVWLCSGQSNMEWPLSGALGGAGAVARANDPDLRIATIAKRTTTSPETSFVEQPSWAAVTPQSVGEFSAACYFMGRDLRAANKGPIGLIDASWGGTPIRAWMDEASVRSVDGNAMVDLIATYRSDPNAAARRFGEDWGAWWREQTRDAAGQEPWNASSRLAWKPVPKIAFFNEWGSEWTDYTGAIWLRLTVNLSAAEAARGATLSLGVIDDMDQAFVNGVGVGSTNDWAAERNYPIASGILKPGRNEIVLFVRNSWGPGGLTGPGDKLRLAFADGSQQPLADGWQVAKVASSIGAPPSAPWAGPNGAATIYNGMIAPLGPVALKGAAWYQGETDVNTPGYDRRLAALFANWRTQFRNPTMPFIVVGLAGFGTPRSAPAESGWAAIVNEQRLGAQRDRSAAFVPAIDLGEPTDIHPLNKEEVGRRLALAARAIAYRDPKGQTAPLPLTAAAAATGVTVTFDKPLQALSGAGPIGFELCGDAQGSCRFVNARIAGSTVLLAGDGQPATRVRYAWADYPVVNLYDAGLLPASSFELPISR